MRMDCLQESGELFVWVEADLIFSVKAEQTRELIVDGCG